MAADGGISSGATPVYTLSPDTTSGSFFKDVSTVLGSSNPLTWIRISMTLSPDSTS